MVETSVSDFLEYSPETSVVRRGRFSIRPWPAAAPLAILLLGFWLRVHRLSDVPPGWRDDEVIETTVHARQVLAGEWPLLFVAGEGHEPMYHYVSAAAIAAFGAGLMQVRLVSVAFGVLSLAANHRLAHRLYGQPVAAISTLALAVSFWSLIYSRTKTRHVSMLVFMLLAIYLSRGWWGAARRPWRADVLAGVFLGIGLYTYFAARVAPVMLAVFALYLALFRRDVFRVHWRGMFATFTTAAVIALPLAWTIASQPGAQQRLEVVGAPLAALRQGDWRPALEGALTTLGMFAWTGDPEALYNLPGRSVFGPAVAAFLGLGMLICVARWKEPRFALLPVWLGLGLSPAFVSIPAASLSHTIAAQPAAYLLAAVGLVESGEVLRRPLRLSRTSAEGLGGGFVRRGLLPVAAGALLVGAIAVRDLRDYFHVWPNDGYVRVLYRADLHSAAAWLRDREASALAVSGRLSIWDDRALRLDLGSAAWQPRWFNPESALLIPGDADGAAQEVGPRLMFLDSQPGLDPALEGVMNLLASSDRPQTVAGDGWRVVQLPARVSDGTAASGTGFSNGLELLEWDVLDAGAPGGSVRVLTRWLVGPDFRAPLPDFGGRTESPPQPMQMFVHLLAADGGLIVGDDRIAVDAYTLQAGDVFYQLHRLQLPGDTMPGYYLLSLGQYDPTTGARYRVGQSDSLGLGTLVVGP